MQNERKYLLFLLSKQEYAYAELKYKLKARGHLSDSQIDQLLNEFVEKGWQSDKRYAESVITLAINKLRGKNWIIQKLVYEKKIEKNMVTSLLESKNIDWLIQAAACYQKKYYNSPTHDLADQQRRIQYLLRQGFDYDLALKVIAEILK